ncbi:MAG TPA: glycosyltransferase [Actinomycetota bacterium]|nr:glycosyltransferase [Actinomycetota bacterium]
MLLAWTLTCLVALAASTLLLVSFGHWLRFSFRLAGLIVITAVVLLAGQVSGSLWQLPSSYVLQAEFLLFVCGVVVVGLRPRWNPLGQVFLASFLGAAVAYLAMATQLTFGSGLSIAGMAASALLFLLEASALTISGYFTFESLDVTTRTRTTRPEPPFDPGFHPRVSLQVAAYNEPPGMLIETIQSLEAIEYPNLEILIIDNNTEDRETWGPVEEYCRDRPRVRFFHVDNVEGFKAGALNLSLREFTDPAAEIIGIIDADYLVDPDYLEETVGYFIDPDLAFLQTPQDYRDWEGDPYLTACYDAYRYFFATSMPSRNERNSIIFAGTMGLIRRSALEGLQGWDEWCITEDAEASLRLLKAGWSGLYLHRSFGKGIMPLTFSALKSQRFRWCFGGIQILRKHMGELLPWRRDPGNQLSVPQRLDYLFGGVQWFTDVLYLGFTLVLATTGLLLLLTGRLALRPLLGAAVLLPATLIGSGVLRALWALRKSTGIGMRRAVFAFSNWLSMSWTVALACLQALVRSEGVFLRTPKWRGSHSIGEALRASRAESLIAAALVTLGVLVATVRRSSLFLAFLFLWQAGVYASALFMAWLNVRADLPARLERRQRTEERRERIRRQRRIVAGAATVLALEGIALAVLFAGALHPGTQTRQPFTIPRRNPTDAGPWSALRHLPQTLPSLVPAGLPGVGSADTPGPTPTPGPAGGVVATPAPATSAVPGTSPTPRATASPRASPPPSPSISGSATPTPSATPSRTPTSTVTPTPTATTP